MRPAAGAPAAYAEARVIAADRLVPLPDHISDELAAAALLKGMHRALESRSTTRSTLLTV